MEWVESQLPSRRSSDSSWGWVISWHYRSINLSCSFSWTTIQLKIIISQKSYCGKKRGFTFGISSEFVRLWKIDKMIFPISFLSLSLEVHVSWISTESDVLWCVGGLEIYQGDPNQGIINTMDKKDTLRVHTWERALELLRGLPQHFAEILQWTQIQ